MSPRATSTRFLNPSRDGDSTTALGSLIQGLTTLAGKKLFLISNLNLPWVTWEKRPTASHYTLLSGSWRERWGPPSASSSPDETTPVPSAAPHRTCSPAPSPALLLFYLLVYLSRSELRDLSWVDSWVRYLPCPFTQGRASKITTSLFVLGKLAAGSWASLVLRTREPLAKDAAATAQSFHEGFADSAGTAPQQPPSCTGQAPVASQRWIEMPPDSSHRCQASPRRSGASPAEEHLGRGDSLTFGPRPSFAPIQGSFR